jgi:hypothetical protein
VTTVTAVQHRSPSDSHSLRASGTAISIPRSRNGDRPGELPRAGPGQLAMASPRPGRRTPQLFQLLRSPGGGSSRASEFSPGGNKTGLADRSARDPRRGPGPPVTAIRVGPASARCPARLAFARLLSPAGPATGLAPGRREAPAVWRLSKGGPGPRAGRAAASGPCDRPCEPARSARHRACSVVVVALPSVHQRSPRVVQWSMRPAWYPQGP